MKIVVFDLDETLGYFSQFSMFYYNLENYVEEFNNVKKLGLACNDTFLTT